MQIEFEPFTVHKRFPLTISRGTSAENTNLWVRIAADRTVGWGEAIPFSVSRQGGLTTQQLIAQLQQVCPLLRPLHPLERDRTHLLLTGQGVASAVRAAIDIALHDWAGKAAGLPLWRLWGYDRDRIVKSSVTIGLGTSEAAQARLQQWQSCLGAQVFKVKLGSPEGIGRDRDLFSAVQALAPDAEFTVDANGGWTLDDAIAMAQWLAARGVRHLEQPLPVEHEADYVALGARSPLPIFVDESCFTSADVVRVAPWVQGINIKLMKAGGLSEAQRMIAIAQAFNLKIMFGCYSDSILANTAASHLAPCADYLDLDSHLNLRDDPFLGASWQEGRLFPPDLPGLGVIKR